MQAKYLLTMLAAAMAHGALVKDVCFFWGIENQHKLGGMCNVLGNLESNIVPSKLDLNECIGFDETESEMIWQPMGNAFNEHCSFCDIPKPFIDDFGQLTWPKAPLDLKCRCVHNTTGEMVVSSLNIDNHIYVDKQGSLAC